MPKVIVEFDLPEGQAIPDPREIVMLTSPDWMASWWHISDVHCQANDGVNDDAEEITDDEAREVLRLLDRHSDSCVGINWDVIDSWIDHVKTQRKQVA
jgi:hypothetical protein